MAKRTRRTSAKKSPRKISRKKSSAKKSSDLGRIEELLGEDFASLAEARKALATETGPKRNKASYTVKELSSKSHRTIKSFIPDLESHVDEIDALKDRGDYWAAEIYGAKTFSVYGSIDGLAKKLAQYKGLQEEHPQQALKNIKIIRVSGASALDRYVAQRRKATEESWKRTREKHKLNKKRQRKQASAIKKLQKQIKSLKQKLKQR